GHGRIGCRNRGERDPLAGPGRDSLRVDETVAAYPDAVGRLREIRNDEAALIVGDDDPDEAGAEIGGLRDDPDARLRPVAAHDDAADVVVVDVDVRARLGTGGRADRGENRGAGRGQARFPSSRTTVQSYRSRHRVSSVAGRSPVDRNVSGRARAQVVSDGRRAILAVD